MNAAAKDRLSGIVVVLIGLGTAYASWGYEIGTLQRMGPGFFPLILGCALVGLGLLVMFAAGRNAPQPAGHGARVSERPEWKGWLCIAGGVVAFILLGAFFGLVAATFACVFVAALGDRAATLQQSLVLAAVITAFGAVLFSYLLSVPLPLFAWPFQ